MISELYAPLSFAHIAPTLASSIVGFKDNKMYFS
jgi:hypothetical protein